MPKCREPALGEIFSYPLGMLMVAARDALRPRRNSSLSASGGYCAARGGTRGHAGHENPEARQHSHILKNVRMFLCAEAGVVDAFAGCGRRAVIGCGRRVVTRCGRRVVTRCGRRAVTRCGRRAVIGSGRGGAGNKESGSIWKR